MAREIAVGVAANLIAAAIVYLAAVLFGYLRGNGFALGVAIGLVGTGPMMFLFYRFAGYLDKVVGRALKR
ncbi:hypothetical protein ACTMTJ_34435 [Phytohabitans sp. LJ34]|uniref:hypothetical protein n=1 Tax=Phytohabitans sp. LJ34 TaxID=3452217 RepID=UPI003F890248